MCLRVVDAATVGAGGVAVLLLLLLAVVEELLVDPFFFFFFFVVLPLLPSAREASRSLIFCAASAGYIKTPIGALNLIAFLKREKEWEE